MGEILEQVNRVLPFLGAPLVAFCLPFIFGIPWTRFQDWRDKKEQEKRIGGRQLTLI